MNKAVPLNEPCVFQLRQILSGVVLDPLARHFVMCLYRVHKALEVDARLARFDGDPDLGCNRIEAIAEPLSNIEEHGAIFGICGTDV